MNTEPVTCERCGATGKRPLTHPAPVGWFFMETRIRDTGTAFDGQLMYTYACSAPCTENWQLGPGRQLPGVGLAVAAAIQRREATVTAPPVDLDQLAAKVAQRLRAKPERCAVGNDCKAAECPEHGWIPSDG